MTINPVPKIGVEFDSWINQYTEKMVGIVPFYFELMADLRTLLSQNFQAHGIVDLGGGSGNLTEQMMTWFPKADFSLIDASEEMIAEAHKRFSETNLTTKLQLMQEAHYPIESVDLVAGSFSFHHLTSSDKQLVFQNIFQWLRPGGYLICSDLMVDKGSTDHDDLLAYWKAFVLKSNGEDVWHWLKTHYDQYDHPNAEADQVKWLKEVGFSSIQTIRHDRHWVAMAVRK